MLEKPGVDKLTPTAILSLNRARFTNHLITPINPGVHFRPNQTGEQAESNFQESQLGRKFTVWN